MSRGPPNASLIDIRVSLIVIEKRYQTSLVRRYSYGYSNEKNEVSLALECVNVR